jgi:hypothetical protein
MGAIQRVRNAYILKDDIAGYTIAVERDNVVIDEGDTP